MQSSEKNKREMDVSPRSPGSMETDIATKMVRLGAERDKVLHKLSCVWLGKLQVADAVSCVVAEATHIAPPHAVTRGRAGHRRNCVIHEQLFEPRIRS